MNCNADEYNTSEESEDPEYMYSNYKPRLKPYQPDKELLLYTFLDVKKCPKIINEVISIECKNGSYFADNELPKQKSVLLSDADYKRIEEIKKQRLRY